MKLARFWSRDRGEATGPQGDRVQVVARGWSNESIDAARAKAREIAQRVARRIASPGESAERYPYGERPLPEPGIRPLAHSVVPRNASGPLALNAARLMFVDIDGEPPPPAAAAPEGVLSGLRSLFGKPSPAPSAATPPDPVV